MHGLPDCTGKVRNFRGFTNVFGTGGGVRYKMWPPSVALLVVIDNICQYLSVSLALFWDSGIKPIRKIFGKLCTAPLRFEDSMRSFLQLMRYLRSIYTKHNLCKITGNSNNVKLRGKSASFVQNCARAHNRVINPPLSLAVRTTRVKYFCVVTYCDRLKSHRHTARRRTMSCNVWKRL